MNIIIYGNGDFAKQMHYYFEHDSKYTVIAFCADEAYIHTPILNDLPVCPFETIDTLYPATRYKMFVAVGYSSMRARVSMYEKAKLKNYCCVNYISSSAIIDKNSSIGDNNAILSNVVIEPLVKIGDNNIVWSSAVICHNVCLKNHSFLAAQVLVGGFSKVGNNCFLGFNSTVSDNIELASETLVAAKSLILEDTIKQSKYMGVKAKKISSHPNGIKVQ